MYGRQISDMTTILKIFRTEHDKGIESSSNEPQKKTNEQDEAKTHKMTRSGAPEE